MIEERMNLEVQKGLAREKGYDIIRELILRGGKRKWQKRNLRGQSRI